MLPWAFMTAFWFISPALCLIIRFYLNRENNKRMAILQQKESDSEDEALDTGDGLLSIDEEDLDKSDRENLKFVYPL